MMNNEFIDMIGKAAVVEYERFKILPSLTIAQAILESKPRFSGLFIKKKKENKTKNKYI